MKSPQNWQIIRDTSLNYAFKKLNVKPLNSLNVPETADMLFDA